MPDRLIGRTAVFGTVSQGSSPCRATDRRTEPLILFESGAFLLPAEGDCTPSLQQVMRHSLLDLPQVS